MICGKNRPFVAPSCPSNWILKKPARLSRRTVNQLLGLCQHTHSGHASMDFRNFARKEFSQVPSLVWQLVRRRANRSRVKGPEAAGRIQKQCGMRYFCSIGAFITSFLLLIECPSLLKRKHNRQRYLFIFNYWPIKSVENVLLSLPLFLLSWNVMVLTWCHASDFGLKLDSSQRSHAPSVASESDVCLITRIMLALLFLSKLHMDSLRLFITTRHFHIYALPWMAKTMTHTEEVFIEPPHQVNPFMHPVTQ